MDAATVGAALALVKSMVPELESAAGSANDAAEMAGEAAEAASTAAANARNNDKALNQFIVTAFSIIRQQQQDITELKNRLNALV